MKLKHIHKNTKFSPSIQKQAKILYFAGYKMAEISRQLDIPLTTVNSWKTRDKWKEIAPIGRVEEVLEARLILLINKETKTEADYKEIDLLGRQMERAARVKKYSFGEGNEIDLNPKLKNRYNVTKKPVERNAINEEQQKALEDSFLNGMFDYQKTWHKAGQLHRIRNILKSRQIGATFYFSHEALIDALQTGRNQIFLSASKKQALQFRSYIIDFAKSVDVKLEGENIKLPNGAELIFLGTNSATAQSYHGNLYFDEVFWVAKFDIMRKVASAMAAQKQYRQTYFSTPTTIAHPAFAFWSGKAFNKNRPKDERVEIDISHQNLKGGKLCPDRQWRQIVTIYDAQEGGCNLFNIDDLLFENSREEFEQLFLCQFNDDNNNVFKFADLEKCQVDSLEEWHDFKPFKDRPFADRPVWLGYDPAYTGDRAALVVIAPPRVEGGDYRILEVKTFHGIDFEQQAKEIKKFCDVFNVEKISIDKTGMGTGVFQTVRKFFPRVVGLDYTLELKNEMILKTLNLIQKRRLKFDSGAREIITNFLTIKKQMTKTGRFFTYVSDRSEEASHGDIAWAIMATLLNVPYSENQQNQGTKIFTFD